MKMLIAFQKNSQNREATQAGGGEGVGGVVGREVAFTGDEAGLHDSVTATVRFKRLAFKDSSLASFEVACIL